MTPFEFDQARGMLVAGVDEVGRGALAGPLVSAAVLLDYTQLDTKFLEGIGDSKALTRDRRGELYPLILQHAAAVEIYEQPVARIDEINIHRANLEANHLALQGVYRLDAICLADGFSLPAVKGSPVERVVMGDSLSAAIGAASIIAKVYRDSLMSQLALKCPHYGWETNVGYGTRAHWTGIESHGITQHHRLSFPILKPFDPQHPPLF